MSTVKVTAHLIDDRADHPLRIVPPTIMLLVAVIVRLLVAMDLPARAAPSVNQTYYHTALTAHLGEYLYATSLKPPVTYLIHSGVYRITGWPAAFHQYALLKVVFLMHAGALCLLYAACRRLKINRWAAAAVLTIYSISYVPFELWWQGEHYDHHTLFFTSLLLYTVVRAGTHRSLWNLLAVSGACGLLVAQSTVNAMAAPAGVLVLAVWTAQQADRRRLLAFVRDAAVALALPVLVVLGLSVKNYYSAGVFGTSNLAGPAAIMIVQKTLKHDTQAVRQFAADAGAPDWYLWAYDHAGPRQLTDGTLFGWPDINKAFGICYPPPGPNDDFWPYDYSPLRNKLLDLGQPDIAAIVDQDIADAHQQPWIVAGFSPELSPRWIGQYGRVSVQVFRHMVRERTGEYLASVRDCHRIFYNYGSRLPRHLLAPESRTLEAPVPMKGFFSTVARVFQRLTRWGYAMIYLGWPVAGVGWVLARVLSRQNPRRYRPIAYPWFMPFAVMSLVSVLLAGVFSAMVGTENSRYFMQISPYVIVVFLLCTTALGARLLSLLPGGRSTEAP